MRLAFARELIDLRLASARELIDFSAVLAQFAIRQHKAVPIYILKEVIHSCTTCDGVTKAYVCIPSTVCIYIYILYIYIYILYMILEFIYGLMWGPDLCKKSSWVLGMRRKTCTLNTLLQKWAHLPSVWGFLLWQRQSADLTGVGIG